MADLILRWLAAFHRSHRERALVRELLLLNDHLLQDMGLRRDQLQPDGIHELDRASSRPAAEQNRRGSWPARAPVLEGCG